MITSVKVINQNGEFLKCALDDPDSGYALTNIEGISPGKVNVNIKEIATLDGGTFLNSRIPTRNIVLSYLFLDYVRTENYDTSENAPPYVEMDRSIEVARLDFYTWFQVKKPVTIIIETDHRSPILWSTANRRYMIQGIVESVEVDIFNSMEGAQVSILCPIPYFQLLNLDSENGNNIETAFSQGGSFSFPWSNPRFQKTIEFGSPDDVVREYDTLVHYDGDVDTGVIYTVDFIGAFDHNMIWFEHYGTGSEAELETTMRFNYLAYKAAGNPRVQAGDKLVISTIAGKKSAILYHAEEPINVFSFMEIFDDWLTLHPGINRLKVRCPTYPNEVPNIFVTIEYPVLCSGV